MGVEALQGNVQATPLIGLGFLGLVLAVLAIDLLVAGQGKAKVTLKAALIWSAVWISLAVAFGLGLALWQGAGPAVATKFASGYVLELSLSVDNLFVFLMIFAHYKVPEKYHRKVLFWGILGALVLRAVFIGAGAELVSRWHPILYVFGVFLVYTGIKLLRSGDGAEDPSKNLVVRLAHRYLPVLARYDGDKFFTKVKGKQFATLLLIIVLVIEATDVVFAVDSIPAVFGVTTDPFIVYTSNIFAILGLRSMFFALEGVMHMFRYLKVGLSVILTMIGLKLCFMPWLESAFGFHAGEFWVLGLIALILALSVAASLMIPRKPVRKKKR